MRKNGHLEPKDLDKEVVSKVLQNLPLKDLKSLKQLKLSDTGIDMVGCEE